MSTPPRSVRLYSLIRRLFMDNIEEVSAADSFRAGEEGQEVAALESDLATEAATPTPTHEEFIIASAEAYRASLITPEV